jgi:hypothetical protein
VSSAFAPLRPPPSALPGARLSFEGHATPFPPSPSLNRAAAAWRSVQPLLVVDQAGHLRFNGALASARVPGGSLQPCFATVSGLVV